MKILFVCHGNICRSPMVEFVMKDMLAKMRRDDVVVARQWGHTPWKALMKTRGEV